jgi:hypothetical protein
VIIVVKHFDGPSLPPKQLANYIRGCLEALDGQYSIAIHKEPKRKRVKKNKSKLEDYERPSFKV